jgi:hypothetical protein
MNDLHKASLVRAMAVTAGISLTQYPPPTWAAPTAEVAKRCLRYAYIAYPFKRPGAVPMSGGRAVYFRDCLAKNGDVPVPVRPDQAGAATEKSETSKDR